MKEMNKLRAAHIANYFIEKGLSEGAPISPMKTIKLCYIAQGWYLGITGDELFEDDIQAWKYGPVIKPLYHELKHFGNSGITEQILLPHFSKEEGLRYKLATIKNSDVSSEDQEFISNFLDKVWSEYKGFSAVQLSEITHQQNTPWDIAWNVMGGCNKPDFIIPSDVIKNYYSNLLKKNQNGTNQ